MKQIRSTPGSLNKTGKDLAFREVENALSSLVHDAAHVEYDRYRIKAKFKGYLIDISIK